MSEKVIIVGWHEKEEVFKACHSEKEIPSIGDMIFVFVSEYKVIKKINSYSSNELMRIDLELEMHG